MYKTGINRIKEYMKYGMDILNEDELSKLDPHLYYDAVKNGFDWDWEVNECTPRFVIFFDKDKANSDKGAIVAMITNSNKIDGFVYHDGDDYPFCKLPIEDFIPEKNFIDFLNWVRDLPDTLIEIE